MKFIVFILFSCLTFSSIAQNNNRQDDVFWNPNTETQQNGTTNIYLQRHILKKESFKITDSLISQQDVGILLSENAIWQENLNKGCSLNEIGRQVLIAGLITLPIAIVGDANWWSKTEVTYSSQFVGYGDGHSSTIPKVTYSEKNLHIGTVISIATICTGIIIKLTGTYKIENTLDLYNKKNHPNNETPKAHIEINLQPTSVEQVGDGLAATIVLNF